VRPHIVPLSRVRFHLHVAWSSGLCVSARAVLRGHVERTGMINAPCMLRGSALSWTPPAPRPRSRRRALREEGTRDAGAVSNAVPRTPTAAATGPHQSAPRHSWACTAAPAEPSGKHRKLGALSKLSPRTINYAASVIYIVVLCSLLHARAGRRCLSLSREAFPRWLSSACPRWGRRTSLLHRDQRRTT